MKIIQNTIIVLFVSLLMVQCASKNSKQENKQEGKQECIGKEASCCGEKETSAPEAVLKTECISLQANTLQALVQHQTREQLEGALGKENLSDTVMWFEEGTVKKEVTFVYKNTNDELCYTWEEKGPKITWSNTKAKWSYKGIRCGTTLMELNAINGMPLCFYGFGWDYSGSVKLDKGNISKMGIELSLSPSENCPGSNKLSGDLEFNSADLKEEVLKHLYVREITILPDAANIAAALNNEITGSSPDNTSTNPLTSFVLMGTEPFWSLSFDEKHIQFTPNIDEEVRLIKYTAINDEGSVMTVKGLYENMHYTIKIIKEKCSDGMSDNQYDYSAHITCDNGQEWKGCGKLNKCVLKTNYYDLTEGQSQELKELLGTNSLKALNSNAFEKMWAYLYKTVIRNNTECPLGSPYGTDPSTAYFWFVYNSLPDFVNKQERHRGYYEGESNQSPLNKLMAYAIYRIDRSPENIETIFGYVKPNLTSMVSLVDYKNKFEPKVKGLIQSYDQITKINNYEAVFTQTYQMLDTITGRVQRNYETGEEEYSAQRGAYGFSKYDIEEYMMRRLAISEDERKYLDVSFLSFWMRRYGEGNMNTVYDILLQIKNIYELKEKES